MAESVKEYITNPDKLKLKDSDTKPDLGRYQ